MQVAHAWIPCAAISTRAIPSDALHEVLQSSLIARLLTLVQGRGHVGRCNGNRVARGTTLGGVGRRVRCGEGARGRTRGQGYESRQQQGTAGR